MRRHVEDEHRLPRGHEGATELCPGFTAAVVFPKTIGCQIENWGSFGRVFSMNLAVRTATILRL